MSAEADGGDRNISGAGLSSSWDASARDEGEQLEDTQAKACLTPRDSAESAAAAPQDGTHEAATGPSSSSQPLPMQQSGGQLSSPRSPPAQDQEHACDQRVGCSERGDATRTRASTSNEDSAIDEVATVSGPCAGGTTGNLAGAAQTRDAGTSDVHLVAHNASGRPEEQTTLPSLDPQQVADVDAVLHSSTDPARDLRRILVAKFDEISVLKQCIRHLRQEAVFQQSSAPPEDESSKVASMRKDLQDAERLLSKYDAANKDAMSRIKVLERKLKEQAAATQQEWQRLERQKAQAIKHAVACAQKSDTEVAEKLRRILDLESQVQHLQDVSTQREQELKQQAEALRTENKKLEGQLGSAAQDARSTSDAALAAELKQEMADMRAEYERQLAATNEKLAWFANSQGDAELIEQQARVISDLKARLAAAASGGRDTDRDAQLADLQQQLEQLRQAVAGAAQGGARGASMVEQAVLPLHVQAIQVRDLQDALEVQKARTAQVAEDAEARLHELIQQHEQLKADYATRIEAAEQHAAQLESQRVRELESQLENLRAMQQESAARGSAELAVTCHDAACCTSPIGTSGAEEDRLRTSHDAAHRLQQHAGATSAAEFIANMDYCRCQRCVCASCGREHRSARPSEVNQPAPVDADLHHADTAWTQLQAGASGRDPAVQQAVLSGAPSPAAAQRRDLYHNAATEHALHTARAEVATLAARLEASQMMVLSLQAANNEASQVMADLRKQHAAELSRLCRAHDAMLSAAASEAAAKESHRLGERCMALETQLAQAKAEVSNLQQEVKTLKLGKSWAPSAREMVALESEVQRMADQLRAQEQRWLSFMESATSNISSSRSSLHYEGVRSSISKENLYEQPNVQAQLDFLRDEVQKVIDCATTLQLNKS